MNGRHIVLPPGRGHALIALSVAELSALHTLAQAALSDGKRALGILGGVSAQSSALVRVYAATRAVEILAAAREDLPKGYRVIPPEDED